jgi:hypothetical protein
MTLYTRAADFLARFQFVRGTARAGLLPPRMQGRVRAVSRRPHAPHRAVVMGVELQAWREVDAAFPEFAKLFARRSAKAVDIINAFRGEGDILVLGEAASQRVAAQVRLEASCEVVHLGRAPLPRLIGPEGNVRGWTLDAQGPWRRAQRNTEMNLVLGHMDLGATPLLLAHAEELVRRLALQPASGGDVLVIRPDPVGPARRALAEASFSTLREVASQTGLRVRIFEEHYATHWADDSVLDAFDAALTECAVVVTDGSPLGATALVRGREVIVRGRPFYAGWGLTTDLLPVRRSRTLDLAGFVAGAVLLTARYVAPDGRLADPLEWTGSLR